MRKPKVIWLFVQGKKAKRDQNTDKNIVTLLDEVYGGGGGCGMKDTGSGVRPGSNPASATFQASDMLPKPFELHFLIKITSMLQRWWGN